VAERAVRRQTPEVGAGCLNWARPDLCGGRGVTRVPTAIVLFRQAERACCRPEFERKNAQDSGDSL
jgi:hypothetical protein